ncbi:hypothetical protein GCM10022222_43190 [Amycolatopsis ultiminotia]|uniref:Secreted protein n=1 Tax=Amycolatopsis ultiminotia TaxID=543629 RepID=A0ABP6WT07_9PSEU
MRKPQVAVLAGVTALLLSACGNGGDDGDKVASISAPPSTSAAGTAGGSGGTDTDRGEQMRQFAKCMREHGIDMPDPKGDGSGATIALPGGASDDKLTKAQDACKSLLPNGGQPKPLSPQELDKARKEAKCMREHGVDMPDPDPSGKSARPAIEAGDKGKMAEAAKACGLGTMADAGEPAGEPK